MQQVKQNEQVEQNEHTIQSAKSSTFLKCNETIIIKQLEIWLSPFFLTTKKNSRKSKSQMEISNKQT